MSGGDMFGPVAEETRMKGPREKRDSLEGTLTVGPASIGAGGLGCLRAVAACVVLAAALIACAGAGDERELELAASVQSLEESVAALSAENAELKAEIVALRQEQAELVGAQEAASKAESALADKAQWSKDKGDSSEGAAVERTAGLAEGSGGDVRYVDHPERGRAVLVLPVGFVDGETPLIVSLHGFGGDSAGHSAYVPLHERVNSDGFALLLPNGQLDGQGNRFWNPTDRCCEGGKTGEDDVAYLTELVAEAAKVKDFGPVYLFGYSNGGFMSYHMACKGLPGLRAVASLAGTSYVEDSSCEGAPPVSVLHIHGTADDAILYEGSEIGPDSKGDGERAFYAGAEEMVTRWSRRAGCDWPGTSRPYSTLDLDQYVPGAETQAIRSQSGCAGGIGIELWKGVGSSHSPGYGAGFVDVLLGWLLAQE